jgi:hypothetical protein
MDVHGMDERAIPEGGLDDVKVDAGTTGDVLAIAAPGTRFQGLGFLEPCR